MKRPDPTPIEYMVKQELALEATKQRELKRKKEYYNLIEQGVSSKLACKIVTNEELTFEENVEVAVSKTRRENALEWWLDLIPSEQSRIYDNHNKYLKRVEEVPVTLIEKEYVLQGGK